MTKTLAFVGAAVVAIGLAVAATLPARFGKPGDGERAALFEDFDPGRAQSMKIVKYDEDTSTKHEFEIAHVTDERGRKMWVIKSHKNYPADANTQLAGAASALVGKQRGTPISSNKGLHGKFGVLNPAEEAKGGDRGVGTLVSFADDNGKPFAELIIGQEIKDRHGYRYVRLPDKDDVYQIQIDAEKFSTKFKDWIEPKLLKLEAFKLKNITIRDVGLKTVGPGQFAPVTHDILSLRYDDAATGQRWSLLDESLGTKLEDAKLNDLRNALEDLKIVDVHAKPQALSRILSGKGGEKVSRAELMQINMSLQEHGFFLTPEGIFPSDGEVIAQLEDGLEYVLNFGGLAKLTADQSEAARKEGEKKEGEGDKKEDKPDAKKDGKAGANRYVFVSVGLNKDRVKPAEIKPVPGESLLPAEGDKKSSDGKKAEGADKTEGTKTEGATSGKPKKATLADSVKELQRLNDEGLIDGKELDAQVKAVERENKQALDKYNSDIRTAEKKVKELNELFADWYYVIDEDVYKKIRVKRNDIKTEKPKDEKAKTEKSKDGEKAKDGEKSKEGESKESVKEPAGAAQ